MSEPSAIVSNLDNKSMEKILPKLIKVIEKNVHKHHKLYSLPLFGEYWENTLHNSLVEIGYNTTWKPTRSHKVGEDMQIIEIPNSRISCKSGQFINERSLGKPCVKFNGGRSTSYSTLEDKLKHFCESHDDFYFLLAKNQKFNKKYKLLVFESPVCKVNQLTWTESKSKKTWNGIGNFKACIGKSMSSQLWTTLPLDMIPYQFDIDCSI